MQIQISADSFRNGITKILNVVDKKISRPLLTNCLLKAQDNKLTIIATDLEVSAKVLLDCNVVESGQFCINTKNIFDILRELPDDQVDIVCDNTKNVLKLTCQNINYSLVTAPVDEYPQLVFENTVNNFSISSKNILNLISKISYAISNDETRLMLNGIFMQLSGSTLRGVAIDGYRLAMLDIPDFAQDISQLIDGIIVPKKGVGELKRIAESNMEGSLNFSVDDSFVYVSTNDNYYLSIRLIAREFPKYQAHIPAKTTHSLALNRDAFIDAVKRIRILANEKTNGVKLSLSNNELTISANHAVYGDAVEKLNVNYDGAEINIGFNAKYLLDTLMVLDGEEIAFEFNNELSPVLVKSEALPEFMGIIMPLKL